MKISDLARGRVFRDAIPDGERFRLRFFDGLEIVCEWGNTGPEVRSYDFQILSSEMVIAPQFRYVSGKTVANVWTRGDGRELLIEFTDGHILRSDFKSAPRVAGVDVTIKVPAPEPVFGSVGTF